jgi:chromosome segregation ATPase
VKLRQARRILRERDQINAELAGLDAKRIELDAKVTAAEGARTAVQARLTEANDELTRDLGAMRATEARHKAERQWLAEKHAAELAQLNERVTSEVAQVRERIEGDEAHIRDVRVEADDSHLQVGLALEAVDAHKPREAELRAQLVRLMKLLPDAEAKVAVVTAMEAERAKTRPMPLTPKPRQETGKALLQRGQRLGQPSVPVRLGMASRSPGQIRRMLRGR